MKRTYCDGIGRRDFLRVGAAGALGVNLPLAQLLAAEPKLRATTPISSSCSSRAA